MWPVLFPLKELLWPAVPVLEIPVQPSFPFTELARVTNKEQGSKGAPGFGFFIIAIISLHRNGTQGHITVAHRHPTRGSKDRGAELCSLMTSDKT